MHKPPDLPPGASAPVLAQGAAQDAAQGEESLLALKRRLLGDLSAIAAADIGSVSEHLRTCCHHDLHWRGAHPLNEQRGIEAISQSVWQPLLQALPDLERRDDIFIGGDFDGRRYVAATGHYCGTFERDWLGIPANGQPLFIRYGEVHEIREGLVVQSSCLWDVLDVMRQAGYWPIAPSLGLEGRWSGPITGDGRVMTASDPAQSAANLQQTLDMHQTLGAYNDAAMAGRDGLLNMPQKQHWHPKMMWYGPSGIGTTRGLSGFVDGHQLPFRLGFPDRKGGGQWDEISERKEQLGGGHYVRIGDGAYSLTSGWPSVHALHSGSNFLGLGPTNREVNMRVMDFYLHDDGLIRENWVPLDIIDLLLQCGVDVFDRMDSFFSHRRHTR